MANNDDYDIPASQVMLLTNIYAAIITQIAMNLNEQSGGQADPLKTGKFTERIDEADKIVMNTKERLLDTNQLPVHKFLLGLPR